MARLRAIGHATQRRGEGGVLWLSGASGVGKSHLLQATCAEAAASAYLTGAIVAGWPPEALEGFERYATLCLDDVPSVLGNREREAGLFHLYHRALESGVCLVLSARDSAQRCEFVLPDLASRLRAAPTLHLAALSDDEAVIALAERANRRGFTLPEKTARYLLNHYRRDMHSLCRLLDELDLASLAARRSLTVPFVKSIL